MTTPDDDILADILLGTAGDDHHAAARADALLGIESIAQDAGHDPRLLRKLARRRFLTSLREKKAVDHLITLPGPDEELILILSGIYHGWDLVAAILELALPATVDHLRAATLRFTPTQCTSLCQYLDAGAVARSTVIVSEFFAAHSPEAFAAIHQELTGRGQRLASTRNHCKLIALEFSDGRRVATHGSLNLARCSSFEQVAISGDVPTHDFFAAFIDEVWRSNSVKTLPKVN